MSKFNDGEQVLAKSPNSEEYLRAKVIGSSTGNRIRVQFRGGSEYTVSVADVKPQRTSRSQTRIRGRTTGKSPSRNSPSRKSPARRSPARSPNSQGRKLPVRSTRQAKVTIARLEMQKDNSSDTDRTEESESLNDEPAIQSRLKDLKPRRSIRIMSNASKAERDQKLQKLRGGDRAASLPVDRKSFDEGIDRSFSVQRDDEMKIHYESDTDTDVPSELPKGKMIIHLNLSDPQEWCGRFGALFLVLSLPVCILLLQLACMNNHCSMKNFRIPRLREWKLFLNQNAFLLYAGYLCYIAIMSVLPIGRLVNGQQTKLGILQYRINGIWTLFLTIAIFGGCIHQGYNIDDFLLKKSLALTAAGVVYGTLLSMALYIKSGRTPLSKLNLYGTTNSYIYNFWQGGEISPRVGLIDIKQVIFYAGVIATIIINLAAGVKIVKEVDTFELNNLQQLNYAALASVILQIVYLLDNLIFETKFLSSFEVVYEGTGYMLSVGYLIYPYLGTITTRYLLAHKIHQPMYLIAFCTILFIIGLYIYRASNNQKHEFRKNPFSLAVAHLETIPTSRGRSLIVSGFWGYVRHPNYLGDILVHWSLALLGLAPDILPYILAIFTTLLLIHRAVRDNARCQKRYGYAWEQYCQRVKYIIFYRVF
ncbi:delta(14)-sterol reductase TM7SF2-like [Phymastichus coffea]|uniref:delta(14)-sterol reductase TM7SF2-like n=1 Tax=Phymastichus coffea TaxID=108790 RepID=UPI00273A965B|nr:delta(14)-sterol reductase TM7SF2-like [Phymastichus coffea]XP_058802205.1 delta(14)-sterol reductase TM7SF2-like [Phymastichus coffea]